MALSPDDRADLPTEWGDIQKYRRMRVVKCGSPKQPSYGSTSTLTITLMQLINTLYATIAITIPKLFKDGTMNDSPLESALNVRYLLDGLSEQ